MEARDARVAAQTKYEEALKEERNLQAAYVEKMTNAYTKSESSLFDLTHANVTSEGKEKSLFQ